MQQSQQQTKKKKKKRRGMKQNNKKEEESAAAAAEEEETYHKMALYQMSPTYVLLVQGLCLRGIPFFLFLLVYEYICQNEDHLPICKGKYRRHTVY